MDSNQRHCKVELCSNWAFTGGLCRKHAALQLLSADTDVTSPVGKTKPNPMQLYVKTVELPSQPRAHYDLPSQSRAHYDAVLHKINHVLSSDSVALERTSGHEPPPAAATDARALQPQGKKNSSSASCDATSLPLLHLNLLRAVHLIIPLLFVRD